MFRYVIFDLDGTLLNTLDDLADAGNHVCAAHGWPTHPVEAYKHFVGNGVPKLVERFSPEEVRNAPGFDAVLKEFVAYYDAHKEDKTAPYPGIPELLAKLKEQGIVMSVLTNKGHDLAGPVIEGYYPGVFPMVQGALPGVPAKPEPTLLNRLMERMGAVREEALFVGDSNVDIRTAKNGGLASCGVLWGFRDREELEAEGADHIVSNPEELADLILNG